ncbi:MAG: winged helix-turn-helix transcriptional regulator [Proteobacteria bacterium]|nr:winged helix-turn-helix transcriptional regulator [Pseudomonadota bacterium]
MNSKGPETSKSNDAPGTDEYRALLLLDEISKENRVTQRDLSKRLGIALGLINSYIKNLTTKGYITVSTIPKKRYGYYLTPSGLAEKTRLTYRHLQNFTNLYRVARKDFQILFRALAAAGLKRVAFCGVDEVSEIAFLSLSETDLTLSAVLNATVADKKFFGNEILPIERAGELEIDAVIITSFAGGAAVIDRLIEAGIEPGAIHDISSGGWLKRIE